MTIFFALLVTLIAGLAALIPSREKTLDRVAFAASTLVGIALISIGWPALFHAPMTSQGGLWFVDPFAGLLLCIIGFVQWTAVMVSVPYMRREMHEGIVSMKQARMYFLLVQLFVLSMTLTVLSNNIGIMWVALEATTLATTMLVAFYTKEGSLEAAWKYILVCSVGISLGLLGVLILYFAAVSGGVIGVNDAVTWTALRHAASAINPVYTRWAFVFIFLGYGAKVGLVPMHTWLPDAHGRTPSPMSAMLSGVLLNIALFAIIRFKSIVDVVLGDASWTNHFFLIFGAISFVVPGAFILGQKNYKRLLAYSSVEHMGLIVFAIGLGLPGMIAAIIHIIGHALLKSLLFFGTGNVLLRWKSTKFDRVSQVMKTLPYTGTLFLLGLFGLLAVPPSPIFMAEYLTFSASVAAHPWYSAILLAGGAVIFGGMLLRFIPFLYSNNDNVVLEETHPERWDMSHTAMAIHVAVAAVLGGAFLFPQTYTVLERMAMYLI